MAKLYGIRSKIVHTGAEHVSAQDTAHLRVLVVTAILNCLGDHRLRREDVSDEQFEEWFEMRVLR